MRTSIRIGLGAAAAFAAAGLTAGIAGAEVTDANHTATGVVKDNGRQVDVIITTDKQKADQTCDISLYPVGSSAAADAFAENLNTGKATESTDDQAAATAGLDSAILVQEKAVAVTAGTPKTVTLTVPAEKVATSYTVSAVCDTAETATARSAESSQRAVTTVVGQSATTPGTSTGNGSLPDSLSGVLGELPEALTGLLGDVLGGLPTA
ncbi:hypothetical protein GOHSU_02_02260 [Gordonia hirsuta DSM 44140 = NBRC 16056]|uniref:Uncharacterized protein n=1 Tax=Gordonia hirsuta DSM 44140 = NBRC 16056 TaxID=1121927 RepID=L7L7T1_9ACTN|nr:hypothetical protein [Gordonia hirsuta]GAC56078.1 hypothetical protein GOHSU_02_02260 [Gordonia hirsuta DSM 44140 = NBRC 16056]